MVNSFAFGVGSASSWRIADTYALVIQAGLSRLAVRISATARFAHSHRADLSAGAVGIQTADGYAHPLTATFVDQTLSISRTEWSTDGALADESGSAALGARAGTRFADAGNIGSRIGEETGRTGALSSLVNRVTKSVGTANSWSAARIFTATVDASFVRGTILIPTTTDVTHSFQANVAEEAVVVNRASEHAQLVDALLVESALSIRRAARNAATFLTA